MSTQVAQRREAEETAVSDTGKIPEDEKDTLGPALHLAGLQFFIADISRKTILWNESGSQSFNSEIKDLQEAQSAQALRLLTPEDRKTILRLVQGAIREGKAGPYDVGGGADQPYSQAPTESSAMPIIDLVAVPKYHA